MTLVAVGMLGFLLVLGSALGVVAAMFTAHRVAQSAADLAALAGATVVGSGDPCSAATRVATANGVSLEGCHLEGRDVRVVVEAPGPRWLGQVADISGAARAGPDADP